MAIPIGTDPYGGKRAPSILDREEDQSMWQFYRPESLSTICARTKFDKREVKALYRAFKQSCPNGLLRIAEFQTVFAEFFPNGNANRYSELVFRTLDREEHCDAVNFEKFITCLSTLTRGSIIEKLNWIFDLYDPNRNGVIGIKELMNVAGAVWELKGRRQSNVDRERIIRHILDIHAKMCGLSNSNNSKSSPSSQHLQHHQIFPGQPSPASLPVNLHSPQQSSSQQHPPQHSASAVNIRQTTSTIQDQEENEEEEEDGLGQEQHLIPTTSSSSSVNPAPTPLPTPTTTTTTTINQGIHQKQPHQQQQETQPATVAPPTAVPPFHGGPTTSGSLQYQRPPLLFGPKRSCYGFGSGGPSPTPQSTIGGGAGRSLSVAFGHTIDRQRFLDFCLQSRDICDAVEALTTDWVF